MVTLFLDIDAHGRVAAQTDPARRALADRAGRFVLLPSAADLLVARRTPATGATSARPRCVLAGDLSAFPIADFIAFMQQARLSGVLTVTGDGAERTVAFHEGEVRSAQSSAAGERMGEVAVRLGYASEAQVAEATKSGRPIGKALVDLGILTPNDLYKCLHEQVSEVFHALLLSKSGTFTLVDEDQERPAAPLAVSTQSLLMDGIRRIDELSLFQARIPGPGAVLRRREGGRAQTLRPTENALLALVDGKRTVAEIATAAHLNEFDATKTLFHLAEAGLLEAVAGAAGPASEAERVPAVVRGMNELLRAVGHAVPAGARAGFLDAAQRFLWDAASPFAPLLRELTVAGDGSLDEAALLEAVGGLDPAALAGMEPSGAPARVVLEALREALFFWLFLAGGRVAREVDEELGRTAKQKLGPLEALVTAAAP
jgi:hypothetical protein